MPRVVHLQIQRLSGETPRPIDAATALPGGGLQGDVHAQREARQLLLASTADLARFDLQPGALREQVTLDLPNLMALPDGARLKIGQAEIEVVGDCAPCTHIGELHRVPDRQAYEDALRGYRGKIARVVAVSGRARIAVGDAVQRLP